MSFKLKLLSAVIMIAGSVLLVMFGMRYWPSDRVFSGVDILDEQGVSYYPYLRNHERKRDLDLKAEVLEEILSQRILPHEERLVAVYFGSIPINIQGANYMPDKPTWQEPPNEFIDRFISMSNIKFISIRDMELHIRGENEFLMERTSRTRPILISIHVHFLRDKARVAHSFTDTTGVSNGMVNVEYEMIGGKWQKTVEGQPWVN